jgi:hypothetical protein
MAGASTAMTTMVTETMKAVASAMANRKLHGDHPYMISPYCPESFDGIVKNKLPGKLFFFLRSIRSSSVSYVRALYPGASQYNAN